MTNEQNIKENEISKKFVAFFIKVKEKFLSLSNKKRTLTIACAAVILIAAIVFIVTPKGATGEWYANGYMKGVTLNANGSADVNYLRDPDTKSINHIVLAKSATWRQDGEKVVVSYVSDVYDEEGKTNTVYMLYGKDRDGDEYLKNMETNDYFYRSGSIAESK